jgi:hypothetical protein
MMLLWEFERFLQFNTVDYLGSNKYLCADSEVLLAQENYHL